MSMRVLLRLIFLIPLLALAVPGTAEARTWTLADDSTVDAALVSCRDGVVILEDARGSKRLLSLDTFSAADRAYILEQFPDGEKAPPGQTARRPEPPRPSVQLSEETRKAGKSIEIGKHHPGLTGYEVGDKPPPLSARVQGSSETVSLEDLQGRLVLVTFWASWHRGSLEEQARLVPVYERYHEAGLEIIGISLDSSYRHLSRVEERLGMGWPVRLDSQRRVFRHWGCTALPTTVLLDQNGFIAAENVPAAAVPALARQYLAPNP